MQEGADLIRHTPHGIRHSIAVVIPVLIVFMTVLIVEEITFQAADTAVLIAVTTVETTELMAFHAVLIPVWIVVMTVLIVVEIAVHAVAIAVDMAQ